MTVISVSVTNSETEILAGVPRTVTISTNVPALIFYTLNGSAPNLFSTQYTGPIFLPTDQLTIILNILATNGTDSSPIVTEIYQTNMVDSNLRFPRNNTDEPPGFNLQGLYPFGDNEVPSENLFGNPADVGVTVDNPALPATPTGFDGKGNPTGFTNHPFDIVNYNIVYSTQNAEGETGPGIGNLPAKVQIDPPQPSIGPEQTNQFSNTFDPKAFVIFQDSTKENPNDPPQINRMHFSLENNERARDGNAYFNTGLDAPPVSGTFLRSHYNPRTNMITYYYLDTWTNKWIISTQPFTPNGSFDGNLTGIKISGTGAGMVFEWLPFTRRVLF
jgi:hypothetical protein